MNLVNVYLNVLKKYGQFYGRATRKEYWTFILTNLVVLLLLLVIKWTVIAGFFGSAILLPTFAVTVRRLHDTNKPGWLCLLNAIPPVSMILFVFFLLPSDESRNNYGGECQE